MTVADVVLEVGVGFPTDAMPRCRQGHRRPPTTF